MWPLRGARATPCGQSECRTSISLAGLALGLPGLVQPGVCRQHFLGLSQMLLLEDVTGLQSPRWAGEPQDAMMAIPWGVSGCSTSNTAHLCSVMLAKDLTSLSFGFPICRPGT